VKLSAAQVQQLRKYEEANNFAFEISQGTLCFSGSPVGKDASLTSTNKDYTLRRCSKEQLSVQGPSPRLHARVAITFYQAKLKSPSRSIKSPSRSIKSPSRSINTYVFPLYTLILIFIRSSLHYQQLARPTKTK